MELEFLYFLISLLITGIFSGLIAGLLGVGGGLIVIPVVFYILNFYNFSKDIIMHVAIASSLGVIFITSLSSMYAHYKLNNIDVNVVKKWLIGVVSGSIFGAIIASSINGNILVIIFGVIASIVAISMLLKINIVIANDLPGNFFLNNSISFLIGCFSVLIGIGGGSFSVPTLTAFGKNIWRRDPRDFSAPDYLDLQDNRQDFLDRGLALVATCFQFLGGLMSGVTIRVLDIPL